MAGEFGLGAQSGMNLGSKFTEVRDAKKEAVLGKQQQELLGGLRRKSLGLGGETPEEQEQASMQLLSADPEAAKKFFDTFDSLPTPQQDKIKENNELIARATVNVAQLPDENLAQGLGQTAQRFLDQGNPQLAARTMELAKLAQQDPAAARQQLSIVEGQARDLEKSIASREKMQLEKAKLGEQELKNRLAKQKDQFGMVSELRKDVNAVSKEFTKVRDAKNRVDSIFSTNEEAAAAAADFAKQALANKATNPDDKDLADVSQNTEAFGDMALIFNYMKMLDPGSTVREGEFASVQNTTGVEGQIRNLYNQALRGTRLTPEQRTGLRNQAQGLFKAAKEQNDKDIKKFKNTAKDLDLPMNQIFDDAQFTQMSDEELEAAIQAAEAAEGGQ